MNQRPKTKVWDPLVRIFHWALAGSFLIAYVVEDSWLSLHVYAGYAALALVGLRLIWGLIGTRHARFRDFLFRPAVVAAYLRDVIAFRAGRYLGHNPAGGAMVLALLAAIALTGLSGLALYGAAEFSGPLAPYLGGIGHDQAEVIEEAHEFLANLTLVLVFGHLAGVAVASLQHRENLPKAMVTGRKSIEVPE